MYKILRTPIANHSTDPDFDIDMAASDLAAQVEEAEAEGWAVAGGIQVYTRGPRTGLMQAMTRQTIQVEGAAEAIARHERRRLAETVEAR